MNIDNCFELLISVVVDIIPQLGGLGPKFRYLVISFCHGEGENLSQFHLRALKARSVFFLLKDETGKINNLTDKYIMELSKLKYIKCYITIFEPEYRNFEQLPQRYQLSTTFHFTIEEIFGTLETANLDMSKPHSVIDPIVNRKFGNILHRYNGPNQWQHVHKCTSQKYQSISYQIPSTSSIPYLK